MHRLFVALRPPAAMRQALLSLQGHMAQARWQDDEQLHLTLLFAGEVDRVVADDIAVLLQSITGPRPTVRLDGIGTFDRKGIVHTIWARVAADEALSRLQARVSRAVDRSGARAERRAFLPHVTLARLGRDGIGVDAFLSRNAGLQSQPVTVDAFYLFESVLTRHGATYHAVARYPLKGEPARP